MKISLENKRSDDEKFVLIFEGPATEDHWINSATLGREFLAFEELIVAANKVINGNRARVEVLAGALTPGSVVAPFIISVVEGAQGVMQFAEDNREGIAAAGELIDLIFKPFKYTAEIFRDIATPLAGGAGLIGYLIKKNKTPSSQDTNPTDCPSSEERNEVDAKKDSNPLSSNLEVRKALEKVVSPLKRKGIEKIKYSRVGKYESEIGKEEVEYLDYKEERKELDEERGVAITIEIVEVSFGGNVWSGCVNGKREKITIEDDGFLKSVEERKVYFANGDCLTCDMRRVEYITKRGNVSSKWVVTKVYGPPFFSSTAKQAKLL